MVIMSGMPAANIISGYKGVVDFYLWMGIPVARKWPRSPGKKRSPAVEAQWASFKYAAQSWNDLSGTVRAAYEKQASATGLSGRDMFTRSYISGLYRYPTTP